MILWTNECKLVFHGITRLFILYDFSFYCIIKKASFTLNHFNLLPLQRVMCMSSASLVNRRQSSGLHFSLLILVMLVVLWLISQFSGDGSLIQGSAVENFSTIFISIVLEAFPFVLFGVFVSSLIQLFVTESMLLRLIPKRKLPALAAASVMGLFFPICECANVPVARRLVAKGVPLHVGMTFLMSVAIMNPVVLLSTYYAFNGQWRIALFRGLLGMGGAIIIGFVVSFMKNPHSMIRHVTDHFSTGCGHDHSTDTDCLTDHDPQHEHPLVCGCGSHSHVDHNDRPGRFKDEALDRFFAKVVEIIHHTSIELFSVGRFLILGAFISSFVQSFLPRSMLQSVGERPVISILLMMTLAYGLSLCSEADAFIARTFVGQFTSGAVMAFMIFGPMMDVKNTLMLLEGFTRRFVIRLIGITAMVCFVLSLGINLLGW